jgi:DNA-binding NarL/FixJ family response regulator
MKPVTRGKVVIVDPDKFVRTFLSNALVASGFEITRSASSSREALNGFLKGTADLVLLELSLEDSVDGYSLAHSMRAIDSSIGLVFLTRTHDHRFMTKYDSIKPKGARYLVKSEIENVSEVISVILQTIHRPFNENVNQENMFTEFTDLQVEIWREAAVGDSSSKMALTHNISEKAIEGTLSRIYLTLGIKKDNSSNPRVLLSGAFKRYKGTI